jgi:hypothetical protein
MNEIDNKFVEDAISPDAWQYETIVCMYGASNVYSVEQSCNVCRTCSNVEANASKPFAVILDKAFRHVRKPDSRFYVAHRDRSGEGEMGKRIPTDYLVAAPSLTSGIARLLDFYGQFDSYNESDSELEADYRASLSDWSNVGHDIADAMQQEALLEA